MSATKKKYLTKAQLKKKLANVKALILDVDGVLTDDHIYVGPDGFELKQFHIGDGLSIVLAMRAGLEIIIMSNRPSPATTTRMKDLRIKHVIQEHGSKARLVAEYLEKNNMGFGLDECAYIGNDIMDVYICREVGLSVAVVSAHEELLREVDYVTVYSGGRGAVREVIQMYFDARGLNMIDYISK